MQLDLSRELLTRCDQLLEILKHWNTQWITPPNVLQAVLCVVGALYTVFAWKQWSAIKAQARAIEEQAEFAVVAL